MYQVILGAHSVLRWVILILGVIAFIKAAQGLSGTRPYGATRRAGVFFTAALHLQLILGLSLFMISPFVRAAMADMQATMAAGSARFFIAEHPTFMVAATILMTIGGIVAKNAATEAARHRKAMIFIGLTLLLILLGIPWQRGLI